MSSHSAQPRISLSAKTRTEAQALVEVTGVARNRWRPARERETATTEVLQVINSSPSGLVPVFDAILDRAMSLCEAAFGGLFLLDGEHARGVATRGISARLDDFVRGGFTVMRAGWCTAKPSSTLLIDDERCRLAGEYGAAEFITKPVDFNLLKAQQRQLPAPRPHI